jgi:NADH:ubiquinone oxidoreductase subunit E
MMVISLKSQKHMDRVSYRLYKEDKTIEEISELTGMPVDQVLQQITEYEEVEQSR